MPPIYIMAVITVAIALVFWGGLVYLLSGHERRYFWLLLTGLPLSTLVQVAIRPQAVIAVGRLAHIPPGLGWMTPAWFLAFQVLIGPFIEEVIKISPLLFVRVRRIIVDRTSAFWVGFVLGVSFGLGEAAYIAHAVASTAQYSGLPWYAFTGYLNDRLMACFGHGVFTAVLVSALQRGGRFTLPGLLASFGLHVFLNLPVVAYQFRWISIEVESFAMLVPFVALAVVFERLRRSFSTPEKLGARDEVVYM